MTQVVLNRHGVDHVSLTMTTTGHHVASATTNSQLLDPTLEYVLRINQLNCPTDTIPIFPPNTNVELFRIKRRVPGTTLLAFNAGMATAFDTVFRTTQAGIQHFTAASFLTSVAKQGSNFNGQQDGLGVQGVAPANTNHVYLKISLNADGCTEFVGSAVFWNNFAIVFTERGKNLFGVEEYVNEDLILAITRRADQTLVYEMFDLDYPAPLNIVGTGNVIDPANDQNYDEILNTIRVVGAYPILKNLDHRLFVSVETDLNTLDGIKLVDGIESNDRSIAKHYFEDHTKVLLTSDEGRLLEDVNLELDAYVGQHSFIKKTNPSRHWVTLTSSLEQRFFRFQLYITYRHVVNGKYIFTRYAYPLNEEDYWTVGIEFVSKV